MLSSVPLLISTRHGSPAAGGVLTRACDNIGVLQGPLLDTEVNEARRPHTYSRPCTFEEKQNEPPPRRNPAAPKTHHEIQSSPAIATTSRRRATKHVPRVSPYSPAPIDPGFVESGLVQLSQSVKTTMLHIFTQTGRQADTDKTDRQTDGQTD